MYGRHESVLSLIRSFALACVVLSSSAYGLPQLVNDLIDFQSERFKEVFAVSTEQQRMLIVERYIELLLTSPYTLDVKIDRGELREELGRRFINQAPEADKKKVHNGPEFPEAIDKDVEAIRKYFNGRFENGLLQLNVACNGKMYELPFKVEGAGLVAFDLTLSGVSVPDESLKGMTEKRCLNLFMMAKGEPARLEHISTLDAACPLPLEGAGNCLLHVVDEIVKAANRERVELTDGSKIRCKINGARIPFWQLRIYQGKPTWYESKNYRIKDAQSANYKSEISTIRSYPLKTLFDDVIHLDMGKNTLFREAIAVFEKFASEFMKERENATAAEFMSWLWDKDCSAYAEIQELLTWSKSMNFVFPNTWQFIKEIR